MATIRASGAGGLYIHGCWGGRDPAPVEGRLPRRRRRRSMPETRTRRPRNGARCLTGSLSLRRGSETEPAPARAVDLFNKQRPGLRIDEGVIAEVGRTTKQLDAPQSQAASGLDYSSSPASFQPATSDDESGGWFYVPENGSVKHSSRFDSHLNRRMITVTATHASNDWASFQHMVKADAYRGKRVRFSALIDNTGPGRRDISLTVDHPRFRGGAQGKVEAGHQGLAAMQCCVGRSGERSWMRRLR